MNVQQIFGIAAEDVVGKVVPFSPQKMYAAEVGYNMGNLRLGVSTNAWSEYYGNYDNTAKLPDFFELNASISYSMQLAGADVDLRLQLNNITNNDNYSRAAWTRDFNRNDNLRAKYHMYVVQSPLFNTFLTAVVNL